MKTNILAKDSARKSKGISGHPLQDLRFKKVVVRAKGLTYTGLLLGANEDSLFLKGSMRYLSLAMTDISSIRDAEHKEKTNKSNNIPDNFYFDPRLDSTEDAQSEIRDDHEPQDHCAWPSSPDKDPL